MEASTTIVNVNSENHEKFVAYLGEVIGQNIKNLNSVEEFAALMSTHVDKIIDTLEEEDAEGCFQVLFKDIQLETDGALVSKLVRELTSVLTSNTETNPVLRLRILTNMYNILSSVTTESTPSSFVVLLLAIIKYAGQVGQMSLLQGYFDMLEELVTKWTLSTEEACEVYLQVSLALEGDGSIEKSQTFLIKYLSTCGALKSAISKGEKKLAVKCMVGAVRSPIVCFTERHDILSLRSVSALKNDSEHGELFKLLSIFSSGKLKDYMNFYASGGAALVTKYALDHEQIVDNMRLLSMCSLATEHAEIPYEAIASDLDVPFEDVEHWVVKTISARLIDAKMDQLTRRVMISRCTHRIFGQGQWLELQSKLNSWKMNIRGILETLARTEALQNN
jgi:translation initiation factor 3 subunit M